jgi:hypothetical protein
MGQEKQVILCIFMYIDHILHFMMGFSPQPGWMTVDPPSSVSTGNTHR